MAEASACPKRVGSAHPVHAVALAALAMAGIFLGAPQDAMFALDVSKAIGARAIPQAQLADVKRRLAPPSGPLRWAYAVHLLTCKKGAGSFVLAVLRAEEAFTTLAAVAQGTPAKRLAIIPKHAGSAT